MRPHSLIACSAARVTRSTPSAYSHAQSEIGARQASRAAYYLRAERSFQREQNRLGGLLKQALTEREEKAVLRRTLIEVERNAAELRRVIAHLVRPR